MRDQGESVSHFIRQKLIRVCLASTPLSWWPAPLPVRAVAREFVNQLLTRTKLTPELTFEPGLGSLGQLASSELKSHDLSMIETEDLLTLFDALCRHSSETFIDHWPAALSRDEKALSLAECGFARCVVLRPDWADAHDGLQEELAEYVDHLLRLWILNDLDPGETRKLVLRLTAYVEQKCQRYYWRSAGGLLEAGKEAVDIAQDAIEKTYRGKRKWDPRKRPLLDFLSAVADSELSNLVLSKGHRLREPSVEVYQAAVDGTSDPLPGPDAAIEEAELRERFRQSLSDPDLMRFFELRWKDYSLDEISRETGLPKKKLYTLVRKLKRRYEQFENEKAATKGGGKDRNSG